MGVDSPRSGLQRRPQSDRAAERDERLRNANANAASPGTGRS